MTFFFSFWKILLYQTVISLQYYIKNLDGHRRQVKAGTLEHFITQQTQGKINCILYQLNRAATLDL